MKAWRRTRRMPLTLSPYAVLALASTSAVAFLFCVGLLITHLLWKAMCFGERLAIAPFFSIVLIIISMKILQQSSGVWFIAIPQPWVLLGMNAITILSIVILIRKY